MQIFTSAYYHFIIPPASSVLCVHYQQSVQSNQQDFPKSTTRTQLPNMENTQIPNNTAEMDEEYLEAQRYSQITFAEWTAAEESLRITLGITLTDEEALKQDVKSYENDCIKHLGDLPEALAWYNLRHNVERRRASAKFFPVRKDPHSYVLRNLQEFFVSGPRLQSSEAILERGWDDYANYLRGMGMPGNRAAMVEDFQDNFRAPYIADDRRELSGLPRSEVNMAVNDYRWMIAIFDELIIEHALKGAREDEVRGLIQHTRNFLIRAVRERQPMAENTWKALTASFKDSYNVVMGRPPPANVDDFLHRPSSFRTEETLVWGENGELISTGVRKVRIDKN